MWRDSNGGLACREGLGCSVNVGDLHHSSEGRHNVRHREFARGHEDCRGLAVFVCNGAGRSLAFGSSRRPSQAVPKSAATGFEHAIGNPGIILRWACRDRYL